MKMGVAFVAGTTLALAAGAANAAAFLTFQDPAGGREVVYTAPTKPGALGSLDVTGVVSLQFDLTSFGLGVVTYAGLNYHKTADVGPAIDLGDDNFKAEVYNGHFEYRDPSQGNALILSGDFGTGLSQGPNGANLLVTGLSGALVANATAKSGSLSYGFGTGVIQPGNPGAGSDLPSYLAANNYAFGAAIDGNWTITGIAPVPSLLDDGFLNSFDANAAFSGTIEVNRVPTPGTAALAGVAGLILARRRRA